MYFEFDSISERDRIAANTNAPYTVLTDDNPYRAVYLGKVVAQSADLATVDVELEPDVPVDKRVLPGLVRVPIYGSVPGMVVEIDTARAAQRCIAAFLNGDRTKPAIVAWLNSAISNSAKRSLKIRIRGGIIELGERNGRQIARNLDPVGANEEMTTWMTDISARVSSLTGGPPLVAPLLNIGTISEGSPYARTD